jgi:hypothetical protein
MLMNLLKIFGVGLVVMIVVMVLGHLYVMNEMRNELKKDRGC